MTTHEFAKSLLGGPNIPIQISEGNNCFDIHTMPRKIVLEETRQEALAAFRATHNTTNPTADEYRANLDEWFRIEKSLPATSTLVLYPIQYKG